MLSRPALLALALAFVGSAAAHEEQAYNKGFERRVQRSTNLSSLERRFTPTGSTENTSKCTPLELVYFRSGREPQNRLGFLGDPICELLQKEVKDVSCYNVVYDSTMDDQVFSNALGAATASKWINDRSAQCANQRYLVVGYSKGTIPIHEMRTLLPAARERIAASVVIGDALNKMNFIPPAAVNTSWPSNGDYSIKSLCNVNDVICWPGGTSMDQHINPAYIGQMPDLVKWMVKLYKRNLQAPFKKVDTPANH